MIAAVLAGTPDAVHSDLRALAIRRASIPHEVVAEIRLDLMSPPDLGVFTDPPVPLVATCRRPRDGGRFRGSETDRLDLLRRAAAVSRWVDVEADVLDAWSSPPAAVIASLHDFDATPPDLPATVTRLLGPGIALVKVATRTRALLDLMTLAAAIRQAPGRVIAIGLGAAGAASRILADRAGSAWIYARFTRQGAQPPRELVEAGVPDLDELVDFYRGGSLDRETSAFAVVGDRADESIGPLVFNRVFRDLRISGTYVHLKTPSLAGLREACRLLNVRGLSVTTPFKEAVLSVADRVDPAAQGIGAANTLVLSEGEWVASNTDRDGIAGPVRRALESRGRNPRDLAALVIGAGGMGRAAAAALRALECRVTMTSRGPERLAPSAQLVGAQFVAAEAAVRGSWDVVVNATPAGSLRDPRAEPFDLANAIRPKLIVECNYLPRKTRFLRQAAELGIDAVGGDEVYAAQAAAQLAAFVPRAAGRGDLVTSATSWALGFVGSS
jgi:3-dehydroquinate dehydratase/shikimate dehydrogenase